MSSSRTASGGGAVVAYSGRICGLEMPRTRRRKGAPALRAMKPRLSENSDSQLIPWEQPVFRWAGSKRKQLAVLMGMVPVKYSRYFEPFAGSASLFFAIRPPMAVLGDFNTELIAAYRVIRDHPRRVVRRAMAWRQGQRQYESLRATDPAMLDDVSRAARFLYLNRYCFNGVYRTNRRGEFNVPMGSRTGNIPPERVFFRCSRALKSADLRAVDFEDCLGDLKRGDFAYLDPPYTSRSRCTYGEYGYGGFGGGDHDRLIRCLKRIDSAGGAFLLSYAADPGLLESLPKSWTRLDLSVRRHVAGFTMHRQSIAEVLVSNRHTGPAR